MDGTRFHCPLHSCITVRKRRSNPDTGLENHGEIKMKKSLIVLAVAASIVVAGSVGVAQAQKAKKVVYVSSEKAAYTPRPGGGPSMHILRGDPEKGSHATFTKFEPGFDAGMHTHTNDVSIVVIKGAYLYKDDDGEKRVGPGDYLSIPAGPRHWGGCHNIAGRLLI